MASSAYVCYAEDCPVFAEALVSGAAPAGNAAMLGLFAALIPPVAFNGLRYGARIHTALLLLALVVDVVGHVAKILLVANPTSRVYATVYPLGTHWGAVLVGSAAALVLPHVMVIYGDEFRLVSEPGYVNVFFLILDVFILAFQSVGIGFAATAHDAQEASQGVNIHLTGLAIQTFSLVSFLGVYRYFQYKLVHRRYILDDTYAHVYLTRRFRHFLVCIQASISLLLLRAIIRIAVWANSFTSAFARSQLTSFLLDDALVFLSALLLIAYPAGRAFGSAWSPTSPLANPSSSDPSDPPMSTNNPLPFRRRHRRNRSSRIYSHVISLPYSSPSQSPRFSPGSANIRTGMPSGLPAHPSPHYSQQLPTPPPSAPLTSPRNNPVHHRVPYPAATAGSPTQNTGFLEAQESPGLDAAAAAAAAAWTTNGVGVQQQVEQQQGRRGRKWVGGSSGRTEGRPGDEMVEGDALWN
ncbi:hypothetical protein VTJ49DRAFT_5838 [Mycothermus thermophilus]|uniref:Uncharacterized protein n=1 Tax=Humicola insolens TaxID=85995 RepID=A0ABR3VKE5_HUMIN